MTLTAQSADGTSIAYERTGTGPALVLVGGAFSVRQSAAELASLLATNFSVYCYDRRGRGDSTDVQPYAPERELEDLAAVIEATGDPAFVFGHSSGAVLALRAAAAGVPIRRVGAFEPPFTANADGSGVLLDRARQVQAAVDAGDREQAAVVFMRGTGMDDTAIEQARQAPWWQGMLAIAHTLPYDNQLVGDGVVPDRVMSRIRIPALLLYGGDSPEWAGRAVTALADVIPDARTVCLPGQTHGADPAVVSPELVEFFLAP